MPRFSEVLSGEADGYPFRESSIETSCPTCDRIQNLDEAIFDDSTSLESRYLCGNCLDPILAISVKEAGAGWEGRGYELGKWLMRNPRELVIQQTHTGRPIRFIACPRAFD